MTKVDGDIDDSLPEIGDCSANGCDVMGRPNDLVSASRVPDRMSRAWTAKAGYDRRTPESALTAEDARSKRAPRQTLRVRGRQVATPR